MKNQNILPINPSKALHLARKRFGQNFLIDASIIGRLVDCVYLKLEDRLIEIGPGLAALTRPLLQKIERMTVIELDRDLIPFLQTLTGLSVINQDVLTVDFNKLYQGDDHASEQLQPNVQPLRKLRLLGNLPYNISTPIIFHLLKFKAVIQDMHFMLQKEVVERMAASPSDASFGRLSVMVQRYCKVSPLIEIPPESFDPIPKVMSQFVRLEPYTEDPFNILEDHMFEVIVRDAFSSRRKMLRNTLKLHMDAVDFISCEIDPKARAETLSVDDFAKIANHLSQRNRLN